MKKTIRILAFILCMTLFIVPLPFSVNAASASDTIWDETCIILGSTYVGSNNGPCGHSIQLYKLQYGSICEHRIVGTHDVCYEKYYPLAGEECSICHYKIAWPIIEPQSGHNFTIATMTPDGIPVGKCSKCGYDAYTYYTEG